VSPSLHGRPIPRTPEELRAEQQVTLATPRRRYGALSRSLFTFMDVVYGKRRSLAKFKVLELIARVPYQAWENVAYVGMTHVSASPVFARRIFDFVRRARDQQDNEQWHLLILEELLAESGERQGVVRYGVLPQIAAFVYYHTSWVLYALKPGWSHALNADLEDHAEHEYMSFVAENPALDGQPFESAFAADYGRFASRGDLFRQIALDERHHKEDSEARATRPRFE
jgi:ubiquinol oxidase